MTSAREGRTGDLLRLPGVDRLPEGFARKVRYTDSRGGPPSSPGGETRELLLCRVGGRLHALDTLCPHEGGRLAEGPLAEGRYASCPLHLYKFDPRDGRAVGVDCDPARTLPVREVDGVAEVRIDGAGEAG